MKDESTADRKIGVETMNEHGRDLTRKEARAIKHMLFRIKQVEWQISEAEDSIPIWKEEIAKLRAEINAINSAAHNYDPREAASDAERASMEHNRELKK